MEKLGIHILGREDKTVRLYDWNNGFHDTAVTVSLPGAEMLYLLITSVREYAVSHEGDLVPDTEEHRSADCIRPYSFLWSESAKAAGKGVGKVTVVNPDMPDEPVVFEVTLGEAKVDVQHREPAATATMTEAQQRRFELGASMMLADVFARDVFRSIPPVKITILSGRNAAQ